MSALTPPSREEAERIIRGTGILGTLEVAIVEPGGLRKPHWLRSLLDLVEFLTPSDESERPTGRAPVSYADPDRLVAWVRDAVRDPELADRMQKVVDSGRGYQLIAPQLRELALERVMQSWALVKDDASKQ